MQREDNDITGRIRPEKFSAYHLYCVFFWGHLVSTYQQRQPQSPPSSVTMTTKGAIWTSEGQWSSVQPMKQLPPPLMPQYGKGYGGGW